MERALLDCSRCFFSGTAGGLPTYGQISKNPFCLHKMSCRFHCVINADWLRVSGRWMGFDVESLQHRTEFFRLHAARMEGEICPLTLEADPRPRWHRAIGDAHCIVVSTSQPLAMLQIMQVLVAGRSTDGL